MNLDMDSIRKTLYKYFEIPFHKRIEIAKKLNIFDEIDLELNPIKATQKWGKKIVDDNLIHKLVSIMDSDGQTS